MSVDVEQVVRKLVDETFHMSFATVSNNKPWVCEVHFAYDDNLNLYFVSKTSTRHCQEIEVNAAVAGSVVRQHELDEYPGAIYFEGSATKLDNPSDEQISTYVNRLLRDKSELLEMLNEEDGRRMYKVTVENWACFGKFDGTGKGGKNTLTWNGGKK